MSRLVRSKWGVIVMTVAFASMFLGVARLKSRERKKDQPHILDSVQGRLATHLPAKSSDALLARASENARDRAENAVEARQSNPAAARSYDEAGNLFRVRPIPDSPGVIDPAVERPGVAENPTLETDGALVPTLRIHGRRAANLIADGSSRVADALSGWVPHALGAGSGGGGNLPVPAKPTRFVPFGRLIRAELVITLESTQDEMPLVGLVVDPVYNNGKLVIPAGTELHSMARPDRIRDRIVSTSSWKMIFPREGARPNGRQLTFDGIALDREDHDGNGFTWELSDGSYGLRGRVIHNGQTTESLLLFAAEALKAVSGTSMERQQTLLGEQLAVSARNDALTGGQAVLNRFAENIEKEIEHNGVYIQVPAGKEFYVYPRQVIDPDRADIPDNIARVE